MSPYVNHHHKLFGHFIRHIVSAHNSGMKKLMESLGSAIAALMLRMKSDFATLCAGVTPTTNLAAIAPAAYFEVMQMLPVEAKLLNEEARLHCEIPNLMEQLDVLWRLWYDGTTYMLRGCMRVCCTWTDAHLLPVDALVGHSVVSIAFALINDYKLLEGELYGQASELLSALIEHVLHVRQNSLLSAELEAHIYELCCMVPVPSEAPMEIRTAAAYFFMKSTKVFAGLNPGQPSSKLTERGPFCYGQLLQVAKCCDRKTVTASISNWMKLFEYLPHCFEYATHQLFHPTIVLIIDALYDVCRHPQERPKSNSPEYEDMQEYRCQLVDLLAEFINLSDMFPLKTFVMKYITTALDPKTAWMDVEASLFFVRAVVTKMSGKSADEVRETLFDLLHRYIDIRALNPAVSQQIIRLCAECHKRVDRSELRWPYIQQLIDIGMAIFNAQTNMEQDDIHDTLDVIIESCKLLGKYHPTDLVTFQEQFDALQDLATKHPRNLLNSIY
ncbi:hypothetical protein KR044_002054 [Drosophila immigrans]|nr:hypothetical protein KR044_002054 [Drosophila immigrans]